MDVPIYCYGLAFVIGGLVGLSELAGKYNWALWHIVFSTGGSMYLVVNGVVATLAYFAAVQWNFHFGLEGKAEFWRILVVSVLGMGAFRSSFANLKLKNNEFAIGFASLIEVFKKRAETALDRGVFQRHIDEVYPVLTGMSYAASRDYLLAVSQHALQSISAQENAALTKEVAKIDALEVNDATKMQLFSLILVQRTSMKLFVRLAEQAKSNLGPQNDKAVRLAQERLDRLALAKSKL